MVAPALQWKGTAGEWNELLSAADRNCVKPFFDTEGVRTPCIDPECMPHRMLSDQRTLDHLVFGRRLQGRLRADEQTRAHAA